MRAVPIIPSGSSPGDDTIEFTWLHVSYDEKSELRETYGFAGSQSKVNLEGILIRPRGGSSDTLFVMMHPASTLQLLPVPRAAARAGTHVLCAGSRYARNDSALIMEKVVLDLGAYVAHAKTRTGVSEDRAPGLERRRLPSTFLPVAGRTAYDHCHSGG